MGLYFTDILYATMKLEHDNMIVKNLNGRTFSNTFILLYGYLLYYSAISNRFQIMSRTYVVLNTDKKYLVFIILRDKKNVSAKITR